MQIETRRDAAGGCSIGGGFYCAIQFRPLNIFPLEPMTALGDWDL
jgi:hypothetical protein